MGYSCSPGEVGESGTGLKVALPELSNPQISLIMWLLLLNPEPDSFYFFFRSIYSLTSVE